GMRPVAALSAEDIYQALTVPPSSPKEPAMNQSLTALLAALGLTVPEDGELTDEVATAALSAVTTLKSQADKAAALKTDVAALSADLNALKTQAPTAAVDLRRYVPVETYNAVREQMVSLSGSLSKTTLAQTLGKAEQDGRILKFERPYLEGLGNQIGVTALSAQLATRQPIAALTRVQTETLTLPPQNREKTATVALSAEELQAARVLGMTPTAFQKIKTEDAQ
ncbi:MAG: phage protease, partial [Sodalis sp. (in: enterobacteria)]|uniref:phage protease n=1 Tax=Sodalis sp. (in: enterobacteria) TaxID=1898979 RepID=UPI0039E63290